MDPFEIAALVAGGLVGGIINTLAGGGSLLTVPLLVLFGLPGGLANGTNRVGVAAQSVVSAVSFRAQGVSEFRSALPVIAPIAAGSAVGAVGVSQLPDALFERAFGIVMLLLLVPTLFGGEEVRETPGRAWSPGDPR